MIARFWPVIPAVLLLAACSGGGGGVASTPTPTPSASPSSTPNTSLIGPLTSESFANDAVTGTANYPASGAATISSSATTLSVAYDAGTQSYTVNTGGRAQTFRPADRSVADSSTQIAVYKRASGATTDSLTLTNPGTSGSLTYQYVGAGFWQRTVQSGGAASGSFDAFTYGVKTPDAATPRVGSAIYAVDLIGTRAYSDIPVAVRGSGTIQADFATGDILLRGTANDISAAGVVSPYTADWGGDARIASGANSFSGAFTYDRISGGTVAGRFYGPSAQEVGAAFQVGAPGLATVGALIGRNQSGAAPSGKTLLNLTTLQQFVNVDMALFYYPGGGITLDAFTYDPAAKRYAFFSEGYSVDPSNQVAAESNAHFTTYRVTNGGGSNGGAVEHTLKVYVAGPGNDELVLYYAGFSGEQFRLDQSDGSTVRQDNWRAYGVNTDPATMPRLGHGIYNGVLYGTAGKANVSGDRYSVHGTSMFDMNFAATTFSGSLVPVATNDRTGETVAFGTLTFANGSILTDFARFSATVRSGSEDVGGINGKFFGPYAVELGAVFNVTAPAADGSGNYSIAGAAVAKQ